MSRPMDHHGFALLRLVALLEVLHQVGGHAGHARRGAHHLLQRRPAALELGLDALLLVLGQLVHLLVQQGQVFFLEPQLGQAAFVINGDRGPVFLGLLHVVDRDVVAKHGAGVAILAADRRSGEGDERGAGQRVAQVLGVTNLVAGLIERRLKLGMHGAAARVAGHYAFSSCQRLTHKRWSLIWRQTTRLARLEPGLKAVLRAVGFVGNDHDVAALGKHREHVLVLARHELLDGGEDDAARGPIAQQLAQFLPRAGLHRLLTQQVGAQAEHAEQLAIEVVAVGDDDDGGVLHRRLLHHAGGEAGHGDALAAALGVPDHAALAAHAGGAALAGRGHHLRDGRTHRMELVVASNLLDQRAVILEQHEGAQVIEQGRRRQDPAHQGFQFVELTQRVELHPVDGAPLHEALGIGRERPHPGLGAIRDEQQLVVLEHIRYLRLVGLNLVVGLPDVGGLVRRVLQFQQRQRQAVDEQDDVRAARVVRPFDGELVDRPELIA